MSAIFSWRNLHADADVAAGGGMTRPDFTAFSTVFQSKQISQPAGLNFFAGALSHSFEKKGGA
jgi:hypothetical protein